MGNFFGENGKKLLYFAGIVLGLYACFQYLFPLAAPFLAAFLIVYLNEPWVNKVHQKIGIRREILLGGILFLVLLILASGIWGLVSWGTVHAAEIGEGIGQVQQMAGETLHDCCVYLEKKFGLNADAVEQGVLEKAAELTEGMRGDVLPAAARQTAEYFGGIFRAAAFLGITFISTLLLCKDYDELLGYTAKNQLLEPILKLLGDIMHMVGGYLKAQLKIMAIVSVIVIIGLLIARVNGAVLLGALAGLLDALPFIGTGIVLLPVALWQLLQGNWWCACVVAVIYVVCIGAREFLEPRLLGKQMGVFPVVMLFAVYAGVKVFGVSGIFLGPLYVVIAKELWRVIGRK